MLTCRQRDFWGRSYDILLDGNHVTTFSPKAWRSGGTFTLHGIEYDLHTNMWGARYAMATPQGKPVATADRVGRKHWSVEVHGRVYRFERISFWKSDQALMSGDRQIGVIRRTSSWKMSAEADLPGLDLPVQVFVLAVVITMWRRNQAAAASAGA